tara:strand:+ start:93 stop:509 length:417 start_codon:yes stop_codon:yes gene_type:complete
MFFKKKNIDNKNDYLIKVGALLIHTAKIDENYSLEEEEIIKNTLIEIGANKEEIDFIIENAIKKENNSNQILDFTKEVKKLSTEKKINIIESLWKIIYSNKKVDIYEANLMRRLAGLLYIDSRIMGDIKEKIKSKVKK